MILPQTTQVDSRWNLLAQEVLEGYQLTREDALSILNCSDVELLDLVAGSYRLRHRFFGNTIQLYFLVNAKSGLCPEDCGYCSQSKISSAPIAKYRMLSEEKLMDGDKVAAQRQ